MHKGAAGVGWQVALVELGQVLDFMVIKRTKSDVITLSLLTIEQFLLFPKGPPPLILKIILAGCVVSILF